MESAASTFSVFSQSPAEQVSSLLENVALEIEGLGNELLEAAPLASKSVLPWFMVVLIQLRRLMRPLSEWRVSGDSLDQFATKIVLIVFFQ